MWTLRSFSQYQWISLTAVITKVPCLLSIFKSISSRKAKSEEPKIDIKFFVHTKSTSWGGFARQNNTARGAKKPKLYMNAGGRNGIFLSPSTRTKTPLQQNRRPYHHCGSAPSDRNGPQQRSIIKRQATGRPRINRRAYQVRIGCNVSERRCPPKRTFLDEMLQACAQTFPIAGNERATGSILS